MSLSTKEQARLAAQFIKAVYQEFEETLQRLKAEQNAVIDTYVSALKMKKAQKIALLSRPFAEKTAQFLEEMESNFGAEQSVFFKKYSSTRSSHCHIVPRSSKKSPDCYYEGQSGPHSKKDCTTIYS